MKNVYRFLITILLAGALFAAHAGSFKEAHPEEYAALTLLVDAD